MALEKDVVCEEFLDYIWDDRKGFVDLPAKSGEFWQSYYFEWEGECNRAIERRINASFRDEESMYFSVGMFRERGRRAEDFTPTPWAWADLDEVHPREATRIGLKPTIAWESSPKRYQALWRLDHPVGPDTAAKLCQGLAYKLGADRSGWDLVQVLRIPGTRNFKYDDAPFVSLLWHDEASVYEPKQVWGVVRGAIPPGVVLRGTVGDGWGEAPNGARPMRPRTRALLKVPPDATVGQDRSEVLWKIYKDLAECGWGFDAIYKVASESAWNKWAQVRTGPERMRKEITKAILQVRAREEKEKETASEPPKGDGPKFQAPTPYDKFMAQEMEAPRWMIEGIWTDGAHGIIGGEPKTLKTTLALAMGIAVASGKPFLGTFEVHSPGPVLMVQEENSPQNIQDTMHRIAASYGLISKEEIIFSPSPEGSIGSTVASVNFPHDIPFHLWNNQGFNFTQDEYREGLVEWIEVLRPRMLILDPMVEMFGNTNLDHNHEVRPFLTWLRKLRFKYNMAIVLVHHMRKMGAERGGQQLQGSGSFHGWLASALYCKDKTQEQSKGWRRIAVEREFREQGPQPGLKIDLRMGRVGSLDFEAMVSGYNAGDEVLDLVMANGERISQREALKVLSIERKALNRRVHGHPRLAFVGGYSGHPREIVLTSENGDVPSA